MYICDFVDLHRCSLDIFGLFAQDKVWIGWATIPAGEEALDSGPTSRWLGGDAALKISEEQKLSHAVTLRVRDSCQNAEPYHTRY